jgi:spore coat protein CotH
MGLMLIAEIRSEVISQAPPTLSIRFNVGSDQPYTDREGHVYLPDQEWTPQTQAGYIGGYPVSAALPVGGTPDNALYERQRRDWQEYRFSDIPNGAYLVTLRFSQIAVLNDHGPLYSVFDVAIENQTILDDLNVFSQVGSSYALTRRFAVTVADGELNIVSTPVFGESCLAAIEVETRSPDAVAPAPPSDLTITNSYYATLLDWADNLEEDLDGYHVYRAESPDGPYTRLTAKPAYVSRYQDGSLDPGIAYFYRVSAMDVYGNESDLTPQQSAAALGEDDATLPYYQLELSPENLLTLYTDPWSDNEVTGNLIYQGRPFRVQVRYRGDWGRYFAKRSWNIQFPDDSPFPGQDEINLRSDFNDTSLMRSKLATTLFEASGIQPPHAEYVLLALNGEYLGLYIRTEQVDRGFAERMGHNPAVSIYKAIGNRHMDFSRQLSSEQAYYDAFEKKSNMDSNYDDLIAFIELINNAPDETFAYELGRILDVAVYLDYYAVIVLTSNVDFGEHNVYLFHDLTTDRWELIPYDFDNAFGPSGGGREFAHDWPINMGTPEAPIWGWVKNTLLTRVLNVPQFRAYYCHRLAELMDTVFSDAAMYPLIDEVYATIEQDALRDWRKNGWENHDSFVAAPDELKAYVTERKNVLWSQMPAYCPADRLYLRINEVMVDNQTTLPDPDRRSEFPPWLEIYNAGLEEIDLSGMYLTDDLAHPTRFRIADGITLPAGGFITFFADGKPTWGPRHTNFRLNKTGGQVGIFSGDQQVDAHSFGAQIADVSEGRHPDGAEHWISFSKPTAGSSNSLRPPVIHSLIHTPLLPTSSDTVTIAATITDDGPLPTATLYYSATGSDFVPVPMIHTQHNLYAAQVPPQPDGRLVEYYILAQDDDGQTSIAPRIQADPVYEYVVGYQPPAVLINELMADNETIVCDPDEPHEFPDWIELYNPGPDPVDLGGRYLTDDPNNPTQFRIAEGITIPVQGFVVFYADNEPEQGPLHTNFKLDRNGESVGLFDVDAAGNYPIDVYFFDQQVADHSEGRCPDSDFPMRYAAPTPGAVNGPCLGTPVIAQVHHTPSFPSATTQLTVNAVIVNDGAAITATLWYSVGSGFTVIPMQSAEQNVYIAAIPTQPDGAGVAYYVQARNERGAIVTDPPLAPRDTHYYLAGYQAPPLFINELMADNATAVEDADEPGEFPDWIELYNAGPAPIDLGGMYLTDDLSDPTQFRIPDSVTIPAGGFALFYADSDPEQGPLHTNFKLNRNGESIGLFDDDTTGNPPIDTLTFDPQATDVSQRRYPDGGETWARSHFPTPNRANTARYLPYLPVILKRTMR